MYNKGHLSIRLKTHILRFDFFRSTYKILFYSGFALDIGYSVLNFLHVLECLRRLSQNPEHLDNLKKCDPSIFRKPYDFDAVSLFFSYSLILNTYLSCSVIVIAMKIMSPKIIMGV